MKHQNEARHEQRKRKTQKVTSDHIQECLTLSEVQATVSVYKNMKSPGPDGVTTEMLTHVTIRELLKIYNHSWSFCTLPHIWREAIIIQISFDKRHT